MPVSGGGATLAERTLAVYVDGSEHSVPVGVVWRDQNASHLIVLKRDYATSLAR
jgi:hypothetical protein